MTTDIQKLQKQILPIVKKHRLASVYLFGSRARGDAKQDSDYDFYIDAPYMEDMLDYGVLFEDMKDVLKANVDIVLVPDKYTKLDGYILQAIQRDGVLVYGQ